MEQIHEQVKSDLLAFGKRNGACKDEYGRLYAASTIEEVIEVVKDNFWWCAKFKDFADVIIAHRELFGEHQIFANQDVNISEGVAYLCVSDGEFNARSFDTSTINAKSCGTSTINAMSCDTSTINAESWNTSTINATSCGTSTEHLDDQRQELRHLDDQRHELEHLDDQRRELEHLDDQRQEL